MLSKSKLPNSKISSTSQNSSHSNNFTSPAQSPNQQRSIPHEFDQSEFLTPNPMPEFKKDGVDEFFKDSRDTGKYRDNHPQPSGPKKRSDQQKESPSKG